MHVRVHDFRKDNYFGINNYLAHANVVDTWKTLHNKTKIQKPQYQLAFETSGLCSQFGSCWGGCHITLENQLLWGVGVDGAHISHTIYKEPPNM